MSQSTPSSTIARSVAGQMWPDVQQQKKLAPGTFWFSCAGHGGIVALVSELDVDESVIQAARDNGLVHYTVRVNHGGHKRVYSTALGYRKQDLLDIVNAYPQHTELCEVWIAEEDCDWATLALVSPALRDGMERKGFGGDHLVMAEILDTVKRYNGDFLNAVLPGA